MQQDQTINNAISRVQYTSTIPVPYRLFIHYCISLDENAEIWIFQKNKILWHGLAHWLRVVGCRPRWQYDICTTFIFLKLTYGTSTSPVWANSKMDVCTVPYFKVESSKVHYNRPQYCTVTLEYNTTYQSVCFIFLRVGIFLDRIFSSFHVTAAQHFNSIFFSTQNSFSCFALMLSGNFLQSTSTGTGNIWCCIISFVLYQQYRTST